jgi:SAM-dependent methyltransferase
LFVQDPPGAEELAAFYDSGEDPAYSDDNRGHLDHYYQGLRKRIEKTVARPGSILDVGCSRGWFLEAMSGWECYGCEIATVAAEIAQRRFGERIFVGSFEDYQAPNEFFDVIALQDVLDHCPQPFSVLAKCYRLLKPGGLMVVKVHDISCLYAKLMGRRFYPIIPPGHLFYFGRHTLGLAVEEAGFKVEAITFIAHKLKISTVFMRLARGNCESLPYRIYSALDGTTLGGLTIRKNLHDIVTLLAVKEPV